MEAAEIPDPEPIVEPKWFLSSKTIAWNLANLTLYALQAVTDANILSPQRQLLLVTFGNMLLRAFTSAPISFKVARREQKKQKEY